MLRSVAIVVFLWLLAPLSGATLAADAPQRDGTPVVVAQAKKPDTAQQIQRTPTKPAPSQIQTLQEASQLEQQLAPAGLQADVEREAMLLGFSSLASLVLVVVISVGRARRFLTVPARPAMGRVRKTSAVAIYTFCQLGFFILLLGGFQVAPAAMAAYGAAGLQTEVLVSYRLVLGAFLAWYVADYIPLIRRVNEALLRRFVPRDLVGTSGTAEAALKSGPSASAETETGDRRSIADRLVSDRPLREGDPDPLGYGALARGISRFLRNEQTQTPLTLAVTGAWGTGKSSIMSLLQADLTRHGYRPVWFNAWHHQQEEHLLAALLETLRVGAFPAWWTPAGIAFRTRLFLVRSRRRPGIFVAIGALVALQIGLILSGAVPEMAELSRLSPVDGTKEETLKVAAALPGIGAVLAVLLTMQVRLRNTLLDPARLTASVGRLVGVGRFRDRLSFRHRFGEEFRDVSGALKPRSLVIMIDDLDRCRPESVLEVLEAVNFLVSSGDCVIVMGLDRTRVIDSVAYSFKDVAAYMEIALPDSTGEEAVQRRAFAENYLEKLVNVEVAVPALPPDAAIKLLREEWPEGATEPATRSWRRRLRRATPVMSALVGILVIGGLAYGLGVMLGADEPDRTGGTGAVPTGPVGDTGDNVWVTAALVVLFAAVLLYELGRRLFSGRRERLLASGDVLEDSDDFTDALEDWYPLMATRLQTPRALKRFVNRLRFLAMLGRDDESDLAPEIDEANFVALAVVERCEPHTLEGLCRASPDRSHSEAYEEAEMNHRKRRGRDCWPPPASLVQRFCEISGGIVTREEEETPHLESAAAAAGE